MRAVIALSSIVLAAVAAGCTPSECADVLEHTKQIEQALSGDLSAARAPAKALGERLAKGGPDWVPLRSESDRLADRIERAGKAPANPEQGAHDARELKAAIDAWRSAAQGARGVCN